MIGRFEDYVRRLKVPTFGEDLVATLDRRTYLPIISGRPFERLSSQGLQVLVNLAHALAHHTVAIDRGLPLPGLLVIDGPSSNVGTEGFDSQRLEDAYDLLAEVASAYIENEVRRPGAELLGVRRTGGALAPPRHVADRDSSGPGSKMAAALVRIDPAGRVPWRSRFNDQGGALAAIEISPRTSSE